MKVYIFLKKKERKKAGKRPEISAGEQILGERVEGQKGIESIPVENG